VLTSGFVFGVATDFAVLGGLAAILLARSAGHCWSPAGWPFMSGGHGRQLDEGIVAQRRDGFQRHVAGTLHGPFVVLLQEDGTNERMMTSSLGKMPTTSVRRLISPFTRSIGLVECSFGRCAAGKLI